MNAFMRNMDLEAEKFVGWFEKQPEEMRRRILKRMVNELAGAWTEEFMLMLTEVEDEK